MLRCSKAEIVVPYMFDLLVYYFGYIRMHKKYREAYMADALFIIVLASFTKKQGGHMLTLKIGMT